MTHVLVKILQVSAAMLNVQAELIMNPVVPIISFVPNPNNDCAYRGGNSWIGLYKHTEDSTSPKPLGQYWLDGSTSPFRRWALGQPFDVTFCVLMRQTSGEFDDVSCTDSRSFVCKRTGKKVGQLIDKNLNIAFWRLPLCFCCLLCVRK